jgi:hypothetical protein
MDLELPYPFLKLENGPDIKTGDTTRVVDFLEKRKSIDN